MKKYWNYFKYIMEHKKNENSMILHEDTRRYLEKHI